MFRITNTLQQIRRCGNGTALCCHLKMHNFPRKRNFFNREHLILCLKVLKRNEFTPD